jgi:hypothetical protein
VADDLAIPERTAAIGRAATRLCGLLGWAPLVEVPLPSGRRLDILALQPAGGFAAIEVKSCARDYLSDGKWPEYRAWCDALHFAIDTDFPRHLLPEDVGLIVATGHEAALLRPAPLHPLAAARRRALLHRFARLAALRLAALADPAGARELQAALAVE